MFKSIFAKTNESDAMNNCLRFLLLLPACFLSFNSSAQKLTFKYDRVGNRILREALSETVQPIFNVPNIESATSIIDDTFVRAIPNPVKDWTQIQIQNGVYKRLIIYSSYGVTLYSQQINDGVFDVDMSYFPKGIYLFVLEGDENEPFILKVIKE